MLHPVQITAAMLVRSRHVQMVHGELRLHVQAVIRAKIVQHAVPVKMVLLHVQPAVIILARSRPVQVVHGVQRRPVQEVIHARAVQPVVPV